MAPSGLDTNNSLHVLSYWHYNEASDIETKKIDPQLNVQNLTEEACYDNAYSAHGTNQAAGSTALLNTGVHFEEKQANVPTRTPVWAFAL